MRIWVVYFMSVVLVACAATPTPSVTNPSVQRDSQWPTATLQKSGFDIEKMHRLSQRLESGWHRNAHMVLVEYDGKLVYEKYLAGEDENWGVSIGYRQFDRRSRHDLRSVSKSVTALLLGIALGDDFASALNRPIIDYFPEFRSQIAPGVDEITLHHVLTMSTGLQWNEMDVPYSNSRNDEIQLYYQADPVRYILTKPLRDPPGKTWYYNGGTTMLLAALIEKISGRPFIEFARENLGDPLGIAPKDVEWRGLGIWPTRPTLPSAASGLRATGRDLAKIGSLMLHQGRWQGRQVIPAAWVEVSSRRHLEQTRRDWSFDGIYGYGYQWWHAKFCGEYGRFSAIAAVGYGGQRIFVIPQKQLVVTILAGNYNNGIWRMSEQVVAEIVAAAP